MITDLGRVQILRHQAGLVSQIAGSLALGVGVTTESVGDTALAHEVLRIPLASINPDVDASQTVFRAVLPPGLVGAVYEVGLFSASSAESSSRIIHLPGDDVGRWTNGVFTTTNARASAEDLRVDVAASGTIVSELVELNEDLSQFTSLDRIIIGYTVTANVSSLRFRFGTDSANYFEFLVSTPSAGYHTLSTTLGSATVTGTPDWNLINYVAVSMSATAGGAASVYFDGVRFESTSPNTDSVLVARKVLSSPHIVDQNIPTDIEYAWDVE